jgi:hypothetical protein
MKSIRLLAILMFSLGAASGCRVLGIQAAECTPGSPDTCPPDQFCAVDGYCYFGTDPEAENGGVENGGADAGPNGGADGGPGPADAGPDPADVETLASGEDNVHLLVLASDGTLFWVRNGADSCVRRLPPDGTAQSLFCAANGDTLEGLALSDTRVAWIRNGAGDDDALVATLQNPPPEGATADTLSSALDDVGTAADHGPAMLAARTVGDEDFFAWPQNANDYWEGIEKVIVSAAGDVTQQTRYGGLPGGRQGAPRFTEEHFFFVSESDYYARIMFRNYHTSDESGGYGAYSDSGENTEFPPGVGYATAECNNTMYVSTRGAQDQGGILRSDGSWAGSFLGTEMVIAQVDPDAASAYARGLACDATALYYTTGGLGTDAPGLFRLSLALDAVPERLLTLDDEGGAVVVDDTHIMWADPAAGAIRRTAKP